MITTKQVAKAALFNEHGELLILTRSATDPTRPGRFDFAGGGVDPGESPQQAMVREAKEEIGVELKEQDIHLLYADTSWYDQLSTTRFLFIGNIASDTVIALSYEHDSFQWMPLDEVMRVYDHPVWIGGLKYLQQHKLI